MPLTSGAKLGPYEIQSELGAGGMGEVYRARDSRLDRIVAVKVLPASFAADPDRLRRFEQEARSVAALNHPNILAVHDIGTHDGSPYMVCELLEGETLRARLHGGVLSPRKAVEFAIQIAEGLAAAHEKGIVHRDLKPENIFLTKDGRVKILDFGLAKIAPRGSEPNAAQTLTSAQVALTEAGQVLGTAGYMSPEQVRGLAVDHRSDIFAFGAIFFEMLSGKRAFSRDTAAETMTAILKEDPPELTELNRNISAALERITRHCLEKSPDQRFQSARDLAFDLDALSQHSGSSARQAATPSSIQKLRRFQLPITVLLVALGAGLGFLFGHKQKPSSEVTYHQLTFRKGTVLSARFAPDNRTVIYAAAWGGSPPELFSTRKDSIESRPVGLSQVDLLGISSQGELAVSLKPTTLPGFFGTQGTLGHTPLTGGTAPREMLENVEWSDWSPDGSSLLVVRTVDNVNRIEYPAGKVIYKATPPTWISHPRISRDGKRIAFCEHPTRGDDRGFVTIVNSDGSDPMSFGDFASLYGLAWSSNGDEVWFTADPTATTIARRLMAVSLSGEFRLLAAAPGDLTLHDVSADGTAVIAIDDRERKIFFTDPKTPERELTWLDRAVLGALSPDGKQVLFHEGGKGGGSMGTIFLRKTDGSPAVRLGEGYGVALSPDQKWVLANTPSNPPRSSLIPTGAGEVIELKPSGIENFVPMGFAADSRRVVFLANEPGHQARFFLFDPASAKLLPLTPEGARIGAVTPDGKFLMFRSNKPLPDLVPLDTASPTREIKGLQPAERPILVTDDGKVALIVSPNGLTATVYRLHLDTGERQLVRTLEMHDPTGGFGITRVAATPDGQSFAFNTLRDLSELYLLQGLK
jgi:serine/threonine protein kinase